MPVPAAMCEPGQSTQMLRNQRTADLSEVAIVCISFPNIVSVFVLGRKIAV